MRGRTQRSACVSLPLAASAPRGSSAQLYPYPSPLQRLTARGARAVPPRAARPPARVVPARGRASAYSRSELHATAAARVAQVE